jgi:hypothetical protein
MTDVLWATFHKKQVAIYGFRYDPADYAPISLDPVRIVVRDKTKSEEEFDKTIQKSCEFIHILEAKMGFDLSRVEKVEHEDGGSVWLFTCDKRWIHAPPLFSMLSLFLRVGCYYEGGGKLNDAIKKFKTISHNDAGYLKASRNMRHLILKRGLAIFKPKMEDNYPHADVHTVHDSWGIVNVTKCDAIKALWDLEGLETVVQKKPKKTEEAPTVADENTAVGATELPVELTKATKKKAKKKKKSKAKKKATKKKIAKKKAKKIGKKKAKKKVKVS